MAETEPEARPPLVLAESPDADRDGVIDVRDNCPKHANADQDPTACLCRVTGCEAPSACSRGSVCNAKTGACDAQGVMEAGTPCKVQGYPVPKVGIVGEASGYCNGRGQCATCEKGFADCDHDPANTCETDLSTLSNCGACGMQCPEVANATAVCRDRKCSFVCNPGYFYDTGTKQCYPV